MTRARSFLRLCLATVLLARTSNFLAGHTRAGPPQHDSDLGDLRVVGAGRPQLVFACEIDTDSLESLFSDQAVVRNLKELNAGLALSIMDLSPGRALVVRRLNEAGIAVMAWLALPQEQGYYLNASNSAEAEARFTAFEEWTSEQGLRWAGIGLDIEPNLSDFAAIGNHKLCFASTLLLVTLERTDWGRNIPRISRWPAPQRG